MGSELNFERVFLFTSHIHILSELSAHFRFMLFCNLFIQIRFLLAFIFLFIISPFVTLPCANYLFIPNISNNFLETEGNMCAMSLLQPNFTAHVKRGLNKNLHSLILLQDNHHTVETDVTAIR